MMQKLNDDLARLCKTKLNLNEDKIKVIILSNTNFNRENIL